MTSTVAIFGAGIAGLTVAHELLKQGYKVSMYEKLDVIGGMARSRREKGTNMPTEHSWRGFAPFYENFDQLAQEIPYDDKTTVYDQLSIPAKFYVVKDDSSDPDYRTIDQHTFADKVIATQKFLQVMLSGSERMNNVYAKENLRQYFDSKVSPNAKDLITCVGPWLGLDQSDTSFLDVSKYLEMMTMVRRVHYHDDEGKVWAHGRGLPFRKIDNRWHLMKRPTSEAWFDPWIKYLQEKGLELHLNTSLSGVNIEDGKVQSCSTSRGEIIADKYVIAINPFDFSDIVAGSTELQKDPVMIDCQMITAAGPNVMISFRIAFTEKIEMPGRDAAFSLPDSEFNLTLYPQDEFFTPDVDLGQGVKSLWSGTACVCDVPGSLYNLPAERCSKEQFINEIHHQIKRCLQLQTIVGVHNEGKRIEQFPILETEVWYEWEFGNPGDKVKNQSRKWVTNTSTNDYRPSQTTSFPNLFLAGSHTRTSVVIWSMEGAVESGKKAVKAMGANVELYTHVKPKWARALAHADDVFYKYRMPHVLLIIFFLIILTLVLVILRIKSKPK